MSSSRLFINPLFSLMKLFFIHSKACEVAHQSHFAILPLTHPSLPFPPLCFIISSTRDEQAHLPKWAGTRWVTLANGKGKYSLFILHDLLLLYPLEQYTASLLYSWFQNIIQSSFISFLLKHSQPAADHGSFLSKSRALSFYPLEYWG